MNSNGNSPAPGQPVVPEQANAPRGEGAPVMRRTRSTFLPRQREGAPSVTVSRDSFLNGGSASSAGGTPIIGREREIVGDLPEWSPLPPSELVVRQRRS